MVAVGRRDEVMRDAAPRAQLIDAGSAAVVPGVHDFHLHLIGMARARREVSLEGLATRADVTERLIAASSAGEGGWIRGRGWREELLDTAALCGSERLAGRLAIIYSHDAHSVWASPAALVAAGITAETSDPPGGRIERDR